MDKSVMSVRMKKWAEIIQEAAASGLTKTEFWKMKSVLERIPKEVLEQYIPSRDRMPWKEREGR